MINWLKMMLILMTIWCYLSFSCLIYKTPFFRHTGWTLVKQNLQWFLSDRSHGNCTKNSQLEVKFTWKRPEMNRNMRSKTLDLTNLLPFFLLQNDSIVATRKLTCHHFKWKIHLLSIIFEGSCHFSGEVGMPYLYLWITPNFIKPSFDPKGVDQSKQKNTKTQKTIWNPKTTIF